jgi:spore coat-associated protein N
MRMMSPFRVRGARCQLPTTLSMRLFTSGSNVHKLIASLAVLGAAAAIAGLGTYATFTSSTSASHTIATGTLSLTSGPTNRLGTGASLVAAGDSMQRAIDLNYAGSISFGSATLTTNATTSSALDTDATDGLHMAIDKCSVAWTESGPPYTYTCSGTTSSVLASAPVIGSNLALSNLTLTAGSTDHLRVTVTLPGTAGNSLQNLSSTIAYTFTGVQRAGTSQ